MSIATDGGAVDDDDDEDEDECDGDGSSGDDERRQTYSMQSPSTFHRQQQLPAPASSVDNDDTDNIIDSDSSSFHFAIVGKYEADICESCGQYIMDRYLLRVNNQSWHIDCLRCVLCSLALDQYPSCFVKNDQLYCKHCYSREHSTKCASCSRQITPTDWVRRARHFVYHLACFACDQCKRQLSTGEEFALQDSRLLCKQHYMELMGGDAGAQKAKTKRVRTTFAEEQLSVLQTHFTVDSNPDGADLERIASMTGLSKRVTQVWFQNSRARQKKYQGLKAKQQQQHQHHHHQHPNSDVCSSPKSSGTADESSSDGGMTFPTSVTTTAEEAMVGEQHSVLLTHCIGSSSSLLLHTDDDAYDPD